MANSNENTQNPKENQEKTAEKGSQEHSEHTAENKQPESKDNVEKKDESTCLCKFFTKIAEWICARKNKNSNKANENATENDDAAKQAEMKQADMVEQPKEQVKLTDILETVSKILGISAIFGTFVGGFFIYNYLEYLGQLSIFPEAITNPPALIATAIVFGLILLCFIMQFFLIFLCGYINADKTISRILKYLYRIFFFIVFLVLTGYELYIIFLYIENISSKIFLIFFIVGFDFIFYILGAPILEQKIEKNNLTMTFFTPIFVISIMLIFSSNPALFFRSNRFVRFAENYENSSWYLLYNNFQQNNGSQETNGIDKNDLFKLKQKFKCSAFLETYRRKKGITCSPETRNNALFGYMAWNLGDTKVFCPPTVYNIIRNEEEKEKLGKECIIISGKALQIMPESYISTNTDGIDDGNPDNTGHDDPAIDINTDVRFKNDLNAQSNAGLNNFNVQPILPIQSNAKNMSIQIHYGSCNHDSPRNKDGHPDIGYTDKKICQ
mgnify:FL=1